MSPSFNGIFEALNYDDSKENVSKGVSDLVCKQLVVICKRQLLSLL